MATTNKVRRRILFLSAALQHGHFCDPAHRLFPASLLSTLYLFDNTRHYKLRCWRSHTPSRSASTVSGLSCKEHHCRITSDAEINWIRTLPCRQYVTIAGAARAEEHRSHIRASRSSRRQLSRHVNVAIAASPQLTCYYEVVKQPQHASPSAGKSVSTVCTPTYIAHTYAHTEMLKNHLLDPTAIPILARCRRCLLRRVSREKSANVPYTFSW
ncbi:hypothetical protein HDV63DRAFT_15647 [Trichoderma sp. SZMC 28014]